MLKEVSALKIFKILFKDTIAEVRRIAFWRKCVRRQMKSKRKFFLKIIKIIIKDNTGQTTLSLDQKAKLLLCFFNINSSKRKRCWTRSNQISSFLKKWSKLSWKDNTGQTDFLKNIETKKLEDLLETFSES